MMPPELLPLLLLPEPGHGPETLPGGTPPVRLTGFGDGLPLPVAGGLRWPTPIPIPAVVGGNQG